MSVENSGESQLEYRTSREQYARRQLILASDRIAKFQAFAAKMGVTLSDKSFEYIETIGVVAHAPRIARMLLGQVKAERDGLLCFENVAAMAPAAYAGCFVNPEFTVMAHPCFRRQMHPQAHWAPQFVEMLWALDEPGVRKYVAIDEDRVRVDTGGGHYIELDTWYGAPFDDDLGKVKSSVSKLRPPLDLSGIDLRFHFANVYCLDIKWDEADGIKSFQALEMKTAEVREEMDGGLSVISCSRHMMLPRRMYASQTESPAGRAAGNSRRAA